MIIKGWVVNFCATWLANYSYRNESNFYSRIKHILWTCTTLYVLLHGTNKNKCIRILNVEDPVLLTYFENTLNNYLQIYFEITENAKSVTEIPKKRRYARGYALHSQIQYATQTHWIHNSAQTFQKGVSEFWISIFLKIVILSAFLAFDKIFVNRDAKYITRLISKEVNRYIF